MTESQILTIVLALLALFLLGFVAFFAVPWVRTWWQVRRATAILDQHFEAAASAGGQVTDLERIGQQLSFDARISHLWKEFTHTLHAERSETEVDEFGHPVTFRYRQT